MPIDIISGIPNKKSDEDLELAMDIIKEKLSQGHRFTNDEKDIFVKTFLDGVDEAERELMKEIADANHTYLWVVLLAQWRRCAEWGESMALVSDPDWPTDRT